MVEMRWYQHPDAVVDGGGFATGIRVLQYRYYRTFSFDWSEWIDVPEVSAE